MKVFFTRTIYVLALALLTAIVLSAQSSSGDTDEVIKIDTQLVDVPVTVTARSGEAFKDLKASSFVLYEDGVKQNILNFSAVSEPFEVVLLLDTSGSARNDLQLIERVAAFFIDSLRPGDRVAITAFKMTGSGRELMPAVDNVIGLTSDRAKLHDALAHVATSSGTPFYDGLESIIDINFQNSAGVRSRGRRAIVALTDGVDSTSTAQFADVKNKLSAAGIVTYFIAVDTREFFEDALTGDCGTAMRFSNEQIRRYYRSIGTKNDIEKAATFCQLGEFERLAVSKHLYETADIEMDLMARSSGGGVIPVADLTEARSAFKRVSDEIGTKYTLSYSPSNEKKDGTYRKITVEVKGMPDGTAVRAREGYTAPKDK